MELLNIELQRQALEQNVAKLQQSLKHWQTWEAEYEGLKEEIQGTEDELTPGKLSEIAEGYGGELLNAQEIRVLLGSTDTSRRASGHVLGLISRRQEYVQRNIETIEKQVEAGQVNLRELDEASSTAGGSLPLTDITEELDDDDNVIVSKTTRPEESQVALIRSLRQAGLAEKDIAQTSGKDVGPRPGQEPASASNANDGKVSSTSTQDASGSISPVSAPKAAEDLQMPGESTMQTPQRPPARKKSVSFSADTKAASELFLNDLPEGKKSVSFAEKIAIAPAADPPEARSVAFSPKIEEIPAQPEMKVSFSPSVEEIPPPPLGPNNPDVKVSFSPQVETIPPQPLGPPEHAVDTSQEAKDDLQTQMIKPGEKLIELDEHGNNVKEQVIVPDDETEEDAQTRREMLEYHLNEVGSVVAQIDLKEAFGDDDARSDFTDSEYVEEEDTPYTSGLGSDDDDDDDMGEDEYGRAKGTSLSDDYRKEMKELQERLIGNLGPNPITEEVEEAVPGFDPQDFRKLVIRNKEGMGPGTDAEETEKKASSKKQVSFSDQLDVAPPEVKQARESAEPGADQNPVVDVVAERSAGSSGSGPPSALSSRPSRFKAARSGPAMPEKDASTDDGTILANTLVERPPSESTHAPSPDAHDPLLARRELAADYYRRRNDMIREQGGFKTPTGNEDEGIGELMEERDGKVKKVSRFKAARIGGGN